MVCRLVSVKDVQDLTSDTWQTTLRNAERLQDSSDVLLTTIDAKLAALEEKFARVRSALICKRRCLLFR